MAWEKWESYLGESVCLGCRDGGGERYVLIDEAGTPTYVMGRHLECGWEIVWEPDLMGLVPGENLSMKKRIRNFTEGLGIENMNVYEIVGRVVVLGILAIAAMTFMYSWGTGAKALSGELPAYLVYPLNALGLAALYKFTINKEK